jgi:hypothetical protein
MARGAAREGAIVKAISLSQPWASAIALDLKSIETRSWQTKYRGRIAIHASARPGRGPGAAEALGRLATLTPSVFNGHAHEVANLCFAQGLGADVQNELRVAYDVLPSKAIIAVATLVDVFRVEDVRDEISAIERAFGDYSDGRYAWLLHDVQIVEPVTCAGALGVWDVESDYVSALAAQGVRA